MNKLNYTKLMDANPMEYSEIVNQANQTISFMEHPYKGDEYPVIAVCHEREVAMKKCVVCRKREATVQDRTDVPRYRVRVCQQCHSERLGADLQVIRNRRRRKDASQSIQ